MNQKNLISPDVNNRILEKIQKKINPDIKAIFLKLFLIHIATALVTLSICPQLGVSSFNTGLDLSHSFLIFGKEGCELVCGFFFTSSSIAIGLFFTNRDEVRVLKYNKMYLASVFVLLSIGFLLMFNSQLFVELTILWLVGTLIGVIGTLELGVFILKRI